jgi:multidrug efflux pump subunit AcrA (membrane-fusion protein)
MESLINSVVTEPTAPAVESPPVAEPPPRVHPKPPHRRKYLYLAIGATIVLSAMAWSLTAGRHSTRLVREPPLQTVTIERRDFVRTCRLSGTIEAAQSRVILAPQVAGAQLGSLIVTKLAPAGTRVKRGDLLVQYDPHNQVRVFLDRQAEYRDFVNQIAKKRAEEDAARAKDQTELKKTEDDLKRAELEMLKSELLSRIDAERNQETLEEAKADLKQLRETFDLKRRAAQADIRILEIKRDAAGENMLHAQRNEEQMLARSPIDGIVVLNTIWKGGKMGEVQEGDEVRPGVPFMQVVDSSAMQVRVRVNQVDVPKLRAGQRAKVRLDAYPELVFSARLEQLAPIGSKSEFSDKVRTFTALFSIQGSDPKLMPDLSAAVDVELEGLPNVLVAPREIVEMENGQAYVWVRQRSGARKIPVKVGPMNDTEVVIQSGIEAGAAVLKAGESILNSAL